MKRREVLLGLATAAFGNVSAQPAANVLGIAAILATPPTVSYWVAFIRRFRELGYRDGENLCVTTFDVREGTMEDRSSRRMRTLVTQMAWLRPIR
jgi:hypothetical protein